MMVGSSRRQKLAALVLFPSILLSIHKASSFSFQNAPNAVLHRAFLGSNRTLETISHPKAAFSDDIGSNKYHLAKNLAWTLSTGILSIIIPTTCLPNEAFAADFFPSDEVEGMAAVTQSDLGVSVRRSVVQGAKLADKLDLKWERFSDSLRDEKKCDPGTNRRLFDNGVRRDGTPRNAPVLGALCDPVPLKPMDISENSVKNVLLRLAEDTAADVLNEDRIELKQKVDEVKRLVGPTFTRAGQGSTKSTLSQEEAVETEKRQAYNMDIYTTMRAYGELLNARKSGGALRETARTFDASWGQKILSSLAQNADRKNFRSPFPPPDPDEEQPYDEGALLDALGAVSVVLDKMQDGGLIGHWEISIPEDDYGEVVTIAVDDDVSIGSEILAREQNQPLSGSPVVALIRSALDVKAKISYNIDTFFIDPSTTKQELYNPTQLLISLSDLGNA